MAEIKEKAQEQEIKTRLIEMQDDIRETIRNAEKVKDEQELLIEVIQKSDKAEYFDEFCKQLKETAESVNDQINSLQNKLENLQTVNTAISDDSGTERLINALCQAFGIFKS